MCFAVINRFRRIGVNDVLRRAGMFIRIVNVWRGIRPVRFTVINRFRRIGVNDILRRAGMFVRITLIGLRDSLLSYFCLIRLKLRDP